MNNPTPGLASETIVEQWTFPIGGHVATLTIQSPDSRRIDPEDMDALFEAGLLFKGQIIRRNNARLARIAQPDFEI